MDEITVAQLILEGYSKDMKGLRRFELPHAMMAWPLAILSGAPLILFFADAWKYGAR